jgi:uncharacterized protein (TIGR02270 family)
MAPALMDVVEEHLDEATWLWTQWERALVAPDHDLADTAEVEERLLAHVDGLTEGGAAVADALLWPALESDEPARVCVAALALLNSGLPAQQVRALLQSVGPVQRSAVQRAMEVCEDARLSEALLPLLESKDAELQATALEVLVSRGEAPDAVPGRFLSHEDARLQVAALRALQSPLRTGLYGPLLAALASKHPGVREAAIEAGLRTGVREAWATCRVAAMESRGREPLVLWALGGREEDMTLLIELLRVPERRADALWALGFSGWVSAVEACLEWMADRKVARLAGESFSSMTGLRLEGHLILPEEEPPEEPVPLEQEDLDADLVPRPEDDLPRPDAAAVTSWWRQASQDFKRGTRYLMGYTLQGEVLLTALERGPMRRRHVWARELAIRSRGACQIATRALTRRQRAGLEQAMRRGGPHAPGA